MDTIFYAKFQEISYNNAKETASISSQIQRTRNKIPVKWRSPPKEWLKLNIDAVISESTNRVAIAVVIRDLRGEIRGGFASNILVSSSTMAEAWEMREALLLVKNLERGKVIIELDCLTLIEAIKSGAELWEIDSILHDIQSLQLDLPDYNFTWVPREGNILAHTIAVLKNSNVLFPSWCTTLPPQLNSICRKEMPKVAASVQEPGTPPQ
ncbi:uncharacterized protein LOC107471147 [Arachis duranensis]|uniref:RNase H type-1 domain-containing protein n=2 Tax=Arachis TaxID=3817 RepID=A0A445EJT4_ARAHY|nr:uncharacterized protein LOC107471147 [Arachis duranensis]XP_025671359.1 uncharacterized protein LOC112771005 [Arachis hypogaea]RYR75720.1 hypothetical protein Ahy_A01g000296 [Arachis hypogaea]